MDHFTVDGESLIGFFDLNGEVADHLLPVPALADDMLHQTDIPKARMPDGIAVLLFQESGNVSYPLPPLKIAQARLFTGGREGASADIAHREEGGPWMFLPPPSAPSRWAPEPEIWERMCGKTAEHLEPSSR